MTLVATFYVDEVPVVIGDIAIAGPEKPGEARLIPTVGNTWNIFIEGSGYVIMDLKQKINIIDEHLLVAWCGNYVAAKSVISRIKEINSLSKFSIDSLSNFFSNEAKEIIASLEVVFIGYIFDPNSRTTQSFDYVFNSRSIQRSKNERFGEIKVCGSNPDYFLELAGNSTRLSNTNSDTFQNIILESLQLCNFSFASDEQNLLEYFGGGFEIATFRDNRFQKIYDVSYFSWLCPKPYNIPYLVEKFYKVSYVDDILLIYVAILKQEKGALNAVINDEVVTYPLESICVYPVLPVYKDLSEEELIIELDGRIPIVSSTWNSNLIYLVDYEEDLRTALSHTVFCPNPDQSSIQVDVDSATNSLKIKTSEIKTMSIKTNQLISSQNLQE
jgi:hypothetical protein